MRREQEEIRRLGDPAQGPPEPEPAVPATEARGGTSPDWQRARPGEELPAKPEPELWDPPGDGR